MASRRARAGAVVKLTANFEANLAAIEAFWNANGAPQPYDQLLADLGATVIPNLERFPRLGRPLLSRPVQSVEVLDRIARLQQRIGDSELREYLTGDYLILYAIIDRTVFLLSIKHHRQLSFDLERLWLSGSPLK